MLGGCARDGDVIVVHTLDRLGRTVREVLNLIHHLRERGTGVRNLADAIRVDSASPDDPMAQLALVLLALFARPGLPQLVGIFCLTVTVFAGQVDEKVPGTGNGVGTRLSVCRLHWPARMA